jgi:tRNA 2-thiouridine synthesizing protein E
MTTKKWNGSEVAVDGDGHLANREDWSRELASAIAVEEGVAELGERHWLVLDFMRKVFDETGDAPSIRKLTKESGVTTKELYALFPKGPAKKAAKIAGLPKPTGCI